MANGAWRAKRNSTVSSCRSNYSSSEGLDIVNEGLLKERIKTLEAEVYTLKTRLDALRRAKNTTIVKGGVVKSGRGHANTNGSDIANEKCSCDATISKLKRSHEQELRSQELELKRSHELVMRSHELEMNKLKEQLQAMDHQQDDKLHDKIKQLEHDNEQLLRDKNELQSQLDGVLVANAQLASCNSLLRTKCDQMLEQLSVKEANWSHREEKLQLQLRQQWGERYQEWITKAENKMKELQNINQMLQTRC